MICLIYYSKREDFLGWSWVRFDSKKKVAEVGRILWNTIRNSGNILALFKFLSYVILFIYQNAPGKQGVKWGKNLNKTLVGSPREAVSDLPSMSMCSCFRHVLHRQRGPSPRQTCPPPIHYNQYLLQVKLLLISSFPALPSPQSLMLFLLHCLLVV